MILLRAMRDDCINVLNLLGRGDISKESYDDIIQVYLRCSRGAMKNGARTRDISAREQNQHMVELLGIGNLFENFKIDIISSLSSQLDVL